MIGGGARSGRTEGGAGPALRWGITLVCVLAAALWGWLMAVRASSVEDGGEGIRLYRLGRTEEAYPLLLRAVSLSRLQSKPCVDLGHVAVWALDDGDLRRRLGFEDPWSLARLAFHAYAEGLDRQPGNPDAWAGMAELFRKVRSLSLRQGPVDLSAIGGEEPSILAEADGLVEASYRKAILLEPNNYFHHAYLGDYYERRGERQEAIRSWARAVEIMPDLSWHYYLPSSGIPGDLYRAMSAALERALESNPTFPRERILENMGRLAERAGDVEAALRHYEAAAEAAEDPSVYTYLRGNLLFTEKRYDEAERDLREAARRESLQPHTLALCHTLIGRSRMMDGEVEEAIEHLERARRLNAGAWYIAVDLARAYERRGDEQRAENEYRAAIRLEPGRASAYSGLISLYRRTRQLGQAIPLAEKLVEMFPDNQVFKDQLDALYREIGRPNAG